LTVPYRWFEQHGIRAGDKVGDVAPISQARQEQLMAFGAQTETSTQAQAAAPRRRLSSSAPTSTSAPAQQPPASQTAPAAARRQQLASAPWSQAPTQAGVAPKEM